MKTNEQSNSTMGKLGALSAQIYEVAKDVGIKKCGTAARQLKLIAIEYKAVLLELDRLKFALGEKTQDGLCLERKEALKEELEFIYQYCSTGEDKKTKESHARYRKAIERIRNAKEWADCPVELHD